MAGCLFQSAIHRPLAHKSSSLYKTFYSVDEEKIRTNLIEESTPHSNTLRNFEEHSPRLVLQRSTGQHWDRILGTMESKAYKYRIYPVIDSLAIIEVFVNLGPNTHAVVVRRLCPIDLFVVKIQYESKAWRLTMSLILFPISLKDVTSSTSINWKIWA